MNAHVERFNRTVQEEFIVYHRALLRDSLEGTNEALADWLTWYNGERPHEGLGMLAPLEYYRANYEMESQMY